MTSIRLLSLLTAHLVVALVALVGIGGATRVMEAGLACPDWPLCYGTLLPSRQMNLQVFLEWFHRLDAFLVGLSLIGLQILSLLRRAELPRWFPWASGAALLLVIVQGALGALTVTQLLRFDVVTAHLGTALVLVALASALHQGLDRQGPGRDTGPAVEREATGFPGGWIAAALVTLLVFGQSLCGALMATRWASGRCLAVGEGCAWLGAHRQLASPVAIGVLVLAAALLLAPGHRRDRPYATAAALLVLVQVLLGILSLRLALAVPLVTVGHQITAALLVAVLSALTLRTLPASAVPSPDPAGSPPNTPLETCHG